MRVRWFALPVLFALAPAGFSQAPAILQQNCAGCHGQNAISGLDVRTRDSLLLGGRRGPAVVPGQAAKSLLYIAAEGAGELKMPPGKKLSNDELSALKQWIDEGAPWTGAVSQSKDKRVYKAEDV